jgi:putrescine transport system substrate-binding protein
VTKLIRIIASTTLFVIAACGGGSNTATDSENIVNVYNWADAVAPGVVELFESETGISVNYDTYATSATVDVKLLTGNSGYDVVFHDNLLASRLIDVGVYQKIDPEQLPNLKNLDPKIMRQLDVYESVRGYNTPFHWGTTGFTWNVDLVRERLPDQPMDTSAILFDPKIVSKLADCGVSFHDSVTSLLPMALSYLGLDPNAVDDDSLAAVQELLLGVRPYVRYFSNDKYLSDMPNKEICVSMSWSGDYANALQRAKEAGVDIDLAYSIPKEGGQLWIDGIYIPTDAPHVENAHIFMNYMMRADIAFRNADYSNYATPNAAAIELLSEETRNNPAIYPDEEGLSRAFRTDPHGPMQERARTRVLARVKSGL